MTTAAQNTALILVDPYNDFVHPDGKLYNSVRESLITTNTTLHLSELVVAARHRRIPIYYALHQPWREGNYMGWQRMNSSTTKLQALRVFEEGSWGAEIFEGLEPDVLGNGDVIVSKHWNSR